ncbi:Hemerythrin [Paramagnetospirillum magnetotacticum MS-1]|uniref:Hemerythrin n=1 Tax=Paramagnetospirillum magnetotacticum MS-1 TaxID=272627 RepID=A0A0C2YCT1_PARME|nr:hemerythrin family protein [Paramagnetospirillum magnetotacticum]KIL97524.1 Hemerythrin [Paramagnetospirillum magnetotacticum MS-1]
MSIAWSEALAVGDPSIDADHRRMIELIAQLEAAVCSEIDCAAVGRTLQDLADLCRLHFAREEELQASVGFPETESHRTAHEMLLKRLDAILAHFADGCDEVRTGIIRTLGDSLATWLVSHIVNNDMEFKPYVAGRR